MRTLLKILLVPATVGLTGGAASAAPANVPLNERETSAGTEATQVHYRYRHWRHGYYYRPYRYYHRPYYYHPRRHYGPRVRFHLGIGF